MAAVAVAPWAQRRRAEELIEARKEYTAKPDEAARMRLLARLVDLRKTPRVTSTADAWQAVDAEIARHPMPATADRESAQQAFAGKWDSPRHNYLYRCEWDWTCSGSEDGLKATHGLWRIEGNQPHLRHHLADETRDPSSCSMTETSFSAAPKQLFLHEPRR